MNIKSQSSTIKTKDQHQSYRQNPSKFSSTVKSTNLTVKQKQGHESVQTSLIQKIIQMKIQTQQQYQALLILNKERELRLLQLEQQRQRLKKQFKKVNKPLEEIKIKIQQAKLSLIEKQKYLKKFYTQLDTKLKSNVQSNLFGKLDQIQKSLEQKFITQKQQLYADLADRHQQMETLNNQLIKLRAQRDQLVETFTQISIQSSSQNQGRKKSDSLNKNSLKKASNESNSSSLSQKKKSTPPSRKQQNSENSKITQFQNKKEEKQKRKQNSKKSKIYLQQNIQKLKKEKDVLEKKQKLLKLLLNIDEVHKKYSSYIINALKKEFTIKMRNILTHNLAKSNIKSVSQNPSLAMEIKNEELHLQLDKKIAQKIILQRQIDQRKLGLQRSKEKLNELIAEYGGLQQQMQIITRKSIVNNQKLLNQKQTSHSQKYDCSDSQVTIKPKINQDNHRSTYTSYQKHEEPYDEDL